MDEKYHLAKLQDALSKQNRQNLVLFVDEKSIEEAEFFKDELLADIRMELDNEQVDVF